MHGYYDLSLVFLSYLIAILASYSALYFGSQLTIVTDAKRRLWVTLGALSLGLGIWTMHFVGMRAHIMPVAMTYDLALTATSVLPAVLASALALLMISKPRASQFQIAGAGLVMGLGIVAMHYTGMAAMKLSPGLGYDPLLVAASVAVAIGASWAALTISRILQGVEGTEAVVFQFVAALIMAAAICGMHYVGMAAVSFAPSAMPAADNLLAGNWLGLPLGLFIAAFIVMALVASALDVRRRRRNLAQLSLEEQRRDRLAFYDQTTGLPNRASLDRALLTTLAETSVEPERFGVVYLEMSNYRKLCEGMEEQKRAAMLKGATKRLQWCVGDAFLARHSASTFVAVIPERSANSFVHALKRLGNLAEDADGIIWFAGQARFPDDGRSSRRLLEAAARTRPVRELASAVKDESMAGAVVQSPS
ncbi:MAG: MHYT domain-containing protein [Marinobacter sp.]|uniref:MHYT domain-containing protein n=1 Tax=Marinobacter sp. TaxID=50741 RepID=UPI00299D7A21|nr:MHYT domain-containing protein [Marinobacter sp.]MDX1633658.1 MHYT domain-containing protein [Marinobacter sp.]